MQVIPVIDVRGGLAVAANRGDRARYRPLETPLAASTDPLDVARGLGTLFPFPLLYVADLDGIEGRGADLAVQQSLAEAWLGQEIWVDDGSPGPQTTNVGDPPTAGGGSPRPRSVVNHVLGSETLATLDSYLDARRIAGPAAPLSLDFRGDGFIGPAELLEDATLWPDRVIVMTLARVGSGEGPDIARLTSIIACAGGRKVYAAGGVRDVDDLLALRDIGVAGVLVASALHGGRIAAADLKQFMD